MTIEPSPHQPPEESGSVSSHQVAPRASRAVTVKSLLFGSIGAAVLAALSGFNDDFLGQASLTSHHFPVFAFGSLFLLAACWNPLMRRLAKPLMLSTGELVIFIGMTMAASWVAGSGLNRYFYRQIILPWQANRAQWEAYHILDHLPRNMFPLQADPAFVYIKGIGEYRRYDTDAEGEIIRDSDRIDIHGHVYAVDDRTVEHDERLPTINLIVARPLTGTFDPETAFPAAVQRYQDEGLTRDPILDEESARVNALRDTLRDLRAQGAEVEEQETVEREMESRFSEEQRTYLDVPGVGLRLETDVDYQGVRITPEGHGEMLVPQIHTYEIVYTDFASGMGRHTRIPWVVWLGVLANWGPMLLAFAFMIIASAVIVHRQWSRNEQLSYPLAKVGGAMLDREESSSLPAVFRSRLFWAGVAIVLSIQLIRLLHVWFPQQVPGINLSTSLRFMNDLIPHSRQAGTQQLQIFLFYPMLFAIAYFVSSEIGLTLGISQILLCVVGVQFYVGSGTRMNVASDVASMQAGSYLMYGLVILFVGRHYYWGVLTKALGFGSSDDRVSIDGIWAARVFIVSFLALWGMLTAWVGLDWLMSLIFVLLLAWMFLVFSRIICETGMPFMQMIWWPGMIMTKILGWSVVGAGPMVILYYLGTIFAQDHRECLQPYVANGLKIADDRGIRPRWIALVAILAIVVAMGSGFVSRLRTNYAVGALSTDSYSSQMVPAYTGNRTLSGFIWMHETGEFAIEADGSLRQDPTTGGLVETDPRSGLSKLAKIEPDGRSMGWFIAGVIGVGVFFFLRLRFTVFPLHPVLFLVWGTFPMWRSAYSLLIGWAVKEVIVRFGGGRVYQDLKPLFLGIIVGELLVSLLAVLVGLLYYSITGEIPPQFANMAG